MSTLESMIEQAQKAMKNAYAPYSNFHVGACIRTTQNNFYCGCNYENAAYPLAQCAEASAIGNMINAGEKQIAEIVIIAECAQPCTPCGGCRQRIREFAQPNTVIHMYGADTKNNLVKTLDELLPHSFGPQFLTQKHS